MRWVPTDSPAIFRAAEQPLNQYYIFQTAPCTYIYYLNLEVFGNINLFFLDHLCIYLRLFIIRFLILLFNLDLFCHVL